MSMKKVERRGVKAVAGTIHPPPSAGQSFTQSTTITTTNTTALEGNNFDLCDMTHVYICGTVRCFSCACFKIFFFTTQETVKEHKKKKIVR